MGTIWRVPPVVLREGRVLLDQQCWCWGQDVKHPDGNLLLTLGFTRERHEGEKDLSRYTSGSVRLWAFGLFFEGIWLLRQDFKIRLAPSTMLPDIWTVRDAQIHYPATESEGEQLRAKLHDACAWIAGYEERVSSTWRAETVRRWEKKGVPASEMAAGWRALSEALL